MNWKTLLLTLFMALATVVFVQAQQGPPDGEGGGGGQRGKAPSVEDRLERMQKDLDLTDDQVAKIKPILEDMQKQMEALRESSSGDREKSMEAMKKLMDSEEEKISALLTDEQKTKLAEMKKEREKNRPGPGQGRPPR